MKLLICTQFIPSPRALGNASFPIKSKTAKGRKKEKKTLPVFALSLRTGANPGTDWPCSAAVSDHTSHLKGMDVPLPQPMTNQQDLAMNQTNMGKLRQAANGSRTRQSLTNLHIRSETKSCRTPHKLDLYLHMRQFDCKFANEETIKGRWRGMVRNDHDSIPMSC